MMTKMSTKMSMNLMLEYFIKIYNLHVDILYKVLFRL